MQGNRKHDGLKGRCRMEDDRLVMTGLRKEDEEIETSLRPRHLREYIGQDKVKSSLSIYINAVSYTHLTLPTRIKV